MLKKLSESHRLLSDFSFNRSPFNRSTVSGFVTYFIIEVCLLHCYYAGLFPCFSFFVSCCSYLDAACTDLLEQFQQIDDIIAKEKNCDLEISDRLIRALQFHITITE